MDKAKVLDFVLRFIKEPKTTISGILSANATTGVLFLAAPSLIFGQAGCDFSHVDWSQVATLVTGSTVVGGVIGGVMKDRKGSPDDRAMQTPAPPKV